MSLQRKYKLGFIISLMIHLLIAYCFRAFYPRGHLLNLVLTSALLGSIIGIGAVYGPGKGFSTSVITYLLYIIHGVYIQKISVIESATINLKLFLSNSLMSILVGSLASSLNVGSILLWSFLAQIISDIFVNIVEVTTNPIYYIFTMLPYNSPSYVLNSFASLTYSFVYLGLLTILVKERPRKA